MKSEKNKKTIPFIPIATSLIGLSLCPLIVEATTTIQTPQEASSTNSRAIATFNLKDWSYVETATEITLTNYIGSSTTIYIPGEWNGKQILLPALAMLPTNMTDLQIQEVNGKKVKYNHTTLDKTRGLANRPSLLTVDLSGLDVSEVRTMASLFESSSNLKSINLTGWNTSNVVNMAAMFSGLSNLTSLDLSSFNTSNVTLMNRMFYNMSSLTHLNVSSFNTSKVTTMSSMFNGLSNLTSLDLSSFDTSNVTDMSFMFQGGRSLTSLNISRFNTSKVTNMANMFYELSNLTTLDLQHFNTSNVKSMNGMFRGMSNLTSLNLSGFNTANVTNMGYMFYEVSKLTTLDLRHFNTTNVTVMAYMFYGMSNLTSLDISGFNTSKVTTMQSMFHNVSQLTSLNLNHFNTSQVTTMANMFHQMYSLRTLNIDYFNTSKVRDMRYMFASMSNLTSLDLSSFDTSNVTNTSYMFYMSFLPTLDVSHFNTANVTNMSKMFSGVSQVTSLDVSNFNTTKTTDMSGLFENMGKLTSLDVSNFDTSNVTNMSYMFKGLASLTALDVSCLNTAKVTTMSNMFYGLTNLKTLDLSNFNTSKVKYMDSMFYGLENLTSLDVSSFDTSNVTTMRSMFYRLSSLSSLEVSHFNTSNVTNMTYTFAYSPNLEILDLTGWDTSKTTSLQTVFKTSTQTPLLIITQDEKLKTYNFQSDNRTGTQLTFQANGGQFPDGTTEFSSPEIFTIDSREEEVIQAFIESVGNSKGIPIRKDYQFSGWTTDVIETTNELEMILNRLSATYKAQWKGDSSSDLYSNPFFDDFCGQDFKAPDMPVIKEHGYTEDGFIWLAFDPVEDHGSTYSYYVQATHLNGTGVAFSNIASATVTTGVKGYSWVADSNPDTIPDDIVEQTDHRQINIPTNNSGPYYLHIKALDHAGNASETFHYELTDTTKPTFTLTQNPTDWTNQDVIITIEASDDGTIPSGVKEIILPDGNKVSGDNATFTAIENGTYTFEVIDFMGNSQIESITISNIDKVAPTGSIIIDQDQDELYDEETELHINMSDILDGQEKLSGIAKVEIFDVNGSYSYTMTNPTDYQPTLPWVLVPYELPDGSLKAQVGMTLTDKAGNTTTVYSKEVTIIKVRIDEFYLTDVVHPGIYNSNNPFTRLTYPNIPSQELLIGGSFEFDAIYSYPPTANEMWTADYEANIHYVHPTDGTRVIPITLTRQPVNGSFTTRHTIPMDVKVGTEVYLELSVKVYNGGQKLMGQDSFPDPEGTLLKIGEITGDIREFIRFNEIY